MSSIQYCPLVAEYIPSALHLLHRVNHFELPEERWDKEDLEILIDIFNEGTIIAVDGEQVVGIGMGIFVDIDFEHLPDTEQELIYQADAIRHNPDGNFYYGTDLAVAPQFRGQRIARRLYDLRKEVVIRHNKRGFCAAATVPGFENELHRMSLEQYVDLVVNKEIFDPTLSVQLRNDFKVIRPLKNFFHYPETDHSSVLIYWENEQHEPEAI